MDRKESILIQARKQFTRFGYTKTTMEDIARKSEITKPTLYSYYAGKADIFAAVVDFEQQAFFALIEDKTAPVSTASEKLHIYADLQVESIRKFLLLGETSRRALLDLHPEALKVLRVCRAKEETLLAGWMQDGIDTGEFTSFDVVYAARVFFLSIASLKFQTLVLDNDANDQISVTQTMIDKISADLTGFVKLFLYGLKTRT